MDLLDWHRGGLSSRRLALLIKHLPRDSATIRDTDGEAADWTVTDYLLAAVVDHLAAANWMFSVVNGDEESDPPDQPVPVPRPGDPAETADGGGETSSADGPQAVPSPSELARFFG
ncbi:hypothetical protein P8A21_23825 [Streptomyces poriferorum]|uniref:DUF664 domain-containing protein n=1 Tax=Streptomyces poriferorum TaxID=2798799 RepID=A0ABY9INV5_9ACTN|nr:MULTISPECIES: hypothetical protein [unclassified Streptomyces]MDP5314045.1 hypothetical protein [Streptomyces sp. Alt4]WLQ50315.1 hypothetical protein P8A21_23825 [Streptomyces sp. Alt1]WLQ57018.1 hypothetical protein P8A19_16855 [Streptomyces sp. Alt2]WSI65115.1 hypothetical protein OG471_25145 [Streptomyces sp. NBC_01336]